MYNRYHATIGMNIKYITLSKKARHKRVNIVRFPVCEVVEQAKLISLLQTRSVVAWVLPPRVDWKGQKGTFLSDGDALHFVLGGIYVGLDMIKTYYPEHLGYVHFTVC